MANFSLDFDDVDFTMDEHLAWMPTLDDRNSFGRDHFDQIHQNSIDEGIMLGATGDQLQGWLNQQVAMNEDASTSNFGSMQGTVALGPSLQLVKSDGQSSFRSVPRHDSTTSLQSIGSAASSSSRRGQRITGAYPCGQCDRIFDVPSDLRHHERNHMATESRPYACHHCGQRFLYPKDRSRHILRKHSTPSARVGSLSRTQSLNDVPMLLADGTIPALNTEGSQLQIPSFGRPVNVDSVPEGRCTCGIGGSKGPTTGTHKEESIRFSEQTLGRLENRLEYLHKDLLSVRTKRVEVAELHIREPQATWTQDKELHSDVEGNSDELVDFATPEKITDLQYLLEKQQLQINRLKLDVQFATQDAAFWLDECNHYAWFLRTIPNAPRPPIYAIPEQTGSISLVKYAKGWLGAIRMMFSSTNVESKNTDIGSHLVDRLAHELDHIFIQD